MARRMKRARRHRFVACQKRRAQHKKARLQEALFDYMYRMSMMSPYLPSAIRDCESSSARVASSGGDLGLECGVSAVQGWRSGQEDAHVVAPDFYAERGERLALFAVFDGHGEWGNLVSDFCMKFVRDNLVLHPLFESNVKTALKETFERCDAAMAAAEVPNVHSGTTAVVAVLKGTKLTIASVGDSRAVLGKKDGRAVDLTVDQNPESPGEMDRILKAGGFVKKSNGDGLSSRVYLNKELTQVGLAMSRSLGDVCVKHVGVIATPVVVGAGRG